MRVHFQIAVQLMLVVAVCLLFQFFPSLMLLLLPYSWWWPTSITRARHVLQQQLAHCRLMQRLWFSCSRTTHALNGTQTEVVFWRRLQQVLNEFLSSDRTCLWSGCGVLTRGRDAAIYGEREHEHTNYLNIIICTPTGALLSFVVLWLLSTASTM